MKAFTEFDLTQQLHQLGVKPGSLLVVHAAFSKVAPIRGGPLTLLSALRNALGHSGTLAMPSMADHDDEPFNPASTPCRGMGILADTFWRMPGVLRSDSPHAFAAVGPKAHDITAPHPVNIPHGLDSPIGRVYGLDGQILLLGVGHDANTTIHLAENLAGVPYRKKHTAQLLINGSPKRVCYTEVDHCCQRFSLMDEWLDAAGLQAHASIGYAHARLMSAQAVAQTALAQLQADPFVFLHQPGQCSECDEAWLSLENSPDPHS